MSNSNKTLIIGCSGIGDALWAFSCASYIKDVDVAICARNEVFIPLKKIFGGRFNLIQWDESLSKDDLLIRDENLWQSLTKGYRDAFYEKPDLLFNHPHSFDYTKYNTNPELIKTNRLLLNDYKPVKSWIYLGLTSTTNGYVYPHAPTLIDFLCKNLPNYNFYLPNNIEWDGKIVSFDIKEQYKNLIIDNNPEFDVWYKMLKQCEFGVFSDNGPSHLAFSLGMSRVLIDPQFNRLTHDARWKENTNDSIPINTSPMDIYKLIKTLLEIPPTKLSPRNEILKRIQLGDVNWSQELILKF